MGWIYFLSFKLSCVVLATEFFSHYHNFICPCQERRIPFCLIVSVFCLFVKLLVNSFPIFIFESNTQKRRRRRRRKSKCCKIIYSNNSYIKNGNENLLDVRTELLDLTREDLQVFLIFMFCFEKRNDIICKFTKLTNSNNQFKLLIHIK
jgi:hypothetical protein